MNTLPHFVYQQQQTHVPPWTWRVLCAGPLNHSWRLFTGTQLRYPDKTPSHNGPILCRTTPPPDEDCRWVSGPVLLGDVTGAELENTVTLSHALLCITLVPPSTRQCCLNTTLAGRNGCSSLVISTALDPPPQNFRQETHYKLQKLCQCIMGNLTFNRKYTAKKIIFRSCFPVKILVYTVNKT